MVMLSENDHARIAAAIATAEAGTSGEILCTLSTERHRYIEWVLALSAVVAFLLPALLTVAGFGPSRWAELLGLWQAGPLNDRQTIELYVAVQALTLIGVTLLLWWSPLAQRFAPQSLRQERVHDIAVKQFLVRGVHQTGGRSGILIHASAEDHIVEVIADESIFTRVPAETWADTAAALLAGMARNDPTQGFIDAIAIAGAVLAEHFPPTADNPDELPNRLLILS